MKIPRRPFSNRELTVCGLLSLLPCRGGTFLNVGMRDPLRPESQWWIDIARANAMQTVVLEAFEPNAAAIREAGVVDSVIHGDVRDVAELIRQDVEIALWWHGPEHLVKSESVSALYDLGCVARFSIVGCPHGRHPQGPVRGNPYEEHLSEWDDAEFERDGWTVIPVEDAGRKQPTGHITAWRTR